MNLRNIRLELARTDDFPEGNSQCGYEFIAPLTADGHIDSQAWGKVKDRCTVRHFWSGQEEKYGFLRHVGRGWRFDYDEADEEDDEPFFKVDQHILVPGEYVSITGHDGVRQPFKVVTVTPATADI
jgi:hypothetical protein